MRVKSKVCLTAERDVEMVVRLGKILSLKVLSISERLAVTELGTPEMDVILDWMASTCCFRKV